MKFISFITFLIALFSILEWMLEPASGESYITAVQESNNQWVKPATWASALRQFYLRCRHIKLNPANVRIPMAQ